MSFGRAGPWGSHFSFPAGVSLLAMLLQLHHPLRRIGGGAAGSVEGINDGGGRGGASIAIIGERAGSCVIARRCDVRHNAPSVAARGQSDTPLPPNTLVTVKGKARSQGLGGRGGRPSAQQPPRYGRSAWRSGEGGGDAPPERPQDWHPRSRGSRLRRYLRFSGRAPWGWSRGPSSRIQGQNDCAAPVRKLACAVRPLQRHQHRAG